MNNDQYFLQAELAYRQERIMRARRGRRTGRRWPRTQERQEPR